MKKIIFAAMAAALLMASCGNKAAEEPKQTKDTAAEELISSDDAVKIAADHARENAAGAVAEYLSSKTASDVDCRMTASNGIPAFVVEFELGALEFRYLIDSQNGAVRRYERSIDDDKGRDENISSMDEKGCADFAAWYLDIPENEFEDASASLAPNGEQCIIDYKRGGEQHRAVVILSKLYFACSDTDIGFNGALEDAAAHICANLSEEDAQKVENVILSEPESLDISASGVASERVYDVEIEAGGYEYSYVLNAATGEIVSLECEPDEDFLNPFGGFDAASVPREIENAAGDELVGKILGYEVVEEAGE